jgi:hypothetical protein
MRFDFSIAPMALAVYEPSSRVNKLSGRSHHQTEVFATLEPQVLESKLGPIPPSCLGPDGKFRQETVAERRKRIESSRQRLRKIAEIPIDPDDPPDEE